MMALIPLMFHEDIRREFLPSNIPVPSLTSFVIGSAWVDFILKNSPKDYCFFMFFLGADLEFSV